MYTKYDYTVITKLYTTEFSLQICKIRMQDWDSMKFLFSNTISIVFVSVYLIIKLKQTHYLFPIV